MDRVQVGKWEWAGSGGDAADEAPYISQIEPQEDAPEVAGVYFQDVSNRDETTLVHRDGNDLLFKDGTNPTDLPLSAFVEVTDTKHRALRHLIHFIDDGPADGFSSGAYKESLPAGDPFPTSIIWWESAAKTQKIVEVTITRTGGDATNVKPTPIEWKMYAEDGTTVVATVTDVITYSGVFEHTRTRTITVP